mmetsp:Transcript_29045/g.48762  ORF Transcript_29045/g.48762 Transcript_29045/m.48762 type:complete len:233 (+) Transcript_29045:206-904(+)
MGGRKKKGGDGEASSLEEAQPFTQKQSVKGSVPANAGSQARARGELPGLQVCNGCGKPPPAGENLKRCARCFEVGYCNGECQSGDYCNIEGHWKTHKAACKPLSQDEKASLLLLMAAEDAGGDQSKIDDLTAWYYSVPKVPVSLAESVERLAWKHRKGSPFIVVQGGGNASLATASVYMKSGWQSNDVMGYAPRFAEPDFHQDTHYFVLISAGHPGTESWGVANQRMMFSPQ